MNSLNFTLNQNGGTETGIIRISNPNHYLNIIVPIGTKFHTLSTKLSTDHSNIENKNLILSPIKEYKVLEDISFSFELKLPGAFSFYLFTEKENGPIVRFIVDPLIPINNKLIPTNGLIIQTNFGRCIGFVQDWINNLQPISEIGYNMIHIPPFQELGHYSHYSIKDQLEISKFLFPKNFPKENRWELLRNTMKEIEKQLGIVFMTDIVLNHTSHDSEWLIDHPESGYHEENSPHLRPAIYVDNLISEISNDIALNKVSNLSSNLLSEQRNELLNYIILRINESDLKKFFIIDEEKAINELLNSNEMCLPREIDLLRVRAVNFPAPHRLNILRTKGIINDLEYNMGSIKIDSNYSIALFKPPGEFNDSLLNEFKLALNTINAPLYQKYESILKDISESVVNTFCYNRFDPNGPKLGQITLDKPIVWNYFSKIYINKGKINEKIYHLANNGWIFGKKPTEDFISEKSEAYLRRQVVIWGDSVKLRFGEKKEDNPWLWDYMKSYVESVASVVHGLRLDNAHSTPLSVAEYFIKCARKINPSLYIMAELFTGGEDEDMHYINTIGINSVVREAFHNLTPNALTHFLWLSGGNPVAAIDNLNSDSYIRPLRQIPGVIYDLTHDNPTPFFDRLSISSVISMSASPVATTRGYDDYLPFNPSVVDEFRTYPLSKDLPALQSIKKIINKLHVKMALKNLNEIMSHYYGNLISLYRCNSQTSEGIWMVVRLEGDNWVNELEIPSPVQKLIFEAHLNNINYFDNSIEIIPSKCSIFLNTNINELNSCKIINNKLILDNFPIGSVICFKTKLQNPLLEVLKTLEVSTVAEGFNYWVSQLSFSDLSVLMFRCASEEYSTVGHGPYTFPGYGECFYAGTQGLVRAFDYKNDMGSPVFQNIRDGNWLMDYMCQRLFQIPNLLPIESYMESICLKIKTLPRYLIPKFLDRVIRALDISGRNQIKNNMPNFIKNGDDFIQALAFSSVAFYGPVKNSPLIHSNLLSIFKNTLIENPYCSLAAGLPHFSSGFMRSWGRDTFISLRGIFLTTGRFNEARDHLIAFASCLRHGLIPNLHDSCLNPRYNARDSTWWFLQSFQDYCLLSKEGFSALNWKIPKLFPTDDQTEYQKKWINKKERPIILMYDIIQEILNRHGNGIHFIEWNAGSQIDSVMNENGFKVDIVTDWNNGFIIGGNNNNCGTWMDKMGNSEKAKNKGIPSTPRDGAAIELIGLLTSTLRFLNDLSNKGIYPYKGIKLINKFISWKEWYTLLITNFESWFYIPFNSNFDHQFFIEKSFVGKRGIYKDTVGSTLEFSDYQFRPNLLIAMTVAPELFDPIHAKKCLDLVEERLQGKIGMKTLDPSDWRYNPNYNNSEDSDNYFTSGGFNYHNGPEWVWLTGYFFRASMKFNRGITNNMTLMLANLKSSLLNSFAIGLPELTNENGNYCKDSCPTQAWSIATILDIFYDYNNYSKDEIINWNSNIEELIEIY